MKFIWRLAYAFGFVLPTLASCVVCAGTGAEGWSLNIGYHNPPGATVGFNFMRLWKNVAFEAGIGWLDLNSSSRNSSGKSASSTSLAVAGDLNFKYLFGSGGLRPYVQAGFGAGSVTSVDDSTGIAAGIGGGFWAAECSLLGNLFTPLDL